MKAAMLVPVTLCFFTSTKGHFGHKDVYLRTLNQLHRQFPLDYFGARLAHIKVTPGEEAIAEQMAEELVKRGFELLTTTAAWSRGTSHQIGYMQDVVTVSKDPLVHENPYVLWLEDDSLSVPHDGDYSRLLGDSLRFFDDPEILSVRLLRRCDHAGSPILRQEKNYFFSPHFNFQPAFLRSRDFYLAALTIERNPEATARVQCEMLWRLVLANFTRNPLCHVVWNPDHAETIHLGTPEYPRLVEEYKLT